MILLQLKYHDSGREKDCLPQVGQWNMMNKVNCFILNFYYLGFSMGKSITIIFILESRHHVRIKYKWFNFPLVHVVDVSLFAARLACLKYIGHCGGWVHVGCSCWDIV